MDGDLSKIFYFNYRMKKVLIVDASAIISPILSEIDYEEGYIPQVVVEELKCKESNLLLSLHTCKIQVRNPTEKYIEISTEKSAELGYTSLSKQDIEVAALALEVSEENNSTLSGWIGPENITGVQVVAVTLDNTLKMLLSQLGVQMHDTFDESERKYLQRCYTCTKIYNTEEKIDFCKSCGYSTIKRVAYIEKDGNIELFLSKNYKYNEQILKHRGKPIKSQDQKEYRWYKKDQRKTERKAKVNYETEMKNQEWRI